MLTHISVIDMKSDQIQRNMTVTIIDNRIKSITRKNDHGKNARIIDAAGKYLIPGLWDMHVHMIRRDRLRLFRTLFIANGITGVRDMGSPLSEFVAYKGSRKVNDEEEMPFRIVSAGTMLDGPRPTWPANSLTASNEKEARQRVTELKKAGADFIKVYNLLPREAYFAIADESKKQDLPFAGHVPFSISLTEAVEAGQSSIEHLSKCILSCSREADALDEELRKA